MSTKNKKYIVPASKPRNPLINDPLMKRGGAMGKSDRDNRHLVNIRLSQFTKHQTADDESYNSDDYGFDV